MPIIKQNSVLLYLSDVDWEHGWSSRRRLAEGLAEMDWSVFFTSGPLNVWKKNTPRWERVSVKGGVENANGVELEKPSYKYLIWRKYHYIRKFQNWFYSKHLERSIRKHHSSKQVIAIIYHPRFYEIIKNMSIDKVVYVLYDDISKTPRWNEEIRDMEQKLLDMTDLLIGYSQQMNDRILSQRQMNNRVIQLGVDFDFFHQGIQMPIPKDMGAIDAPKVGWCGQINQKIDFDLVFELASKFQETQFVFIGRENFYPGFKNGKDSKLATWNKIKMLDNIVFLGHKDHQDIPAYMAHMTVNWMPYDLSSGLWVESCYPLKMHEYLAVGNPVISSDVPAVREFSDVIKICRDRKCWEKALQSALNGSYAESTLKRIEVAKNNDWSIRLKNLSYWLREAL